MMTNEEWNRKTEFLLNQQAKFDAGMQELKEAQAITEKKVAETADAAKHALEVAEHALDGVAQLTNLTDQLITVTTDGFREAADRMKHMDGRIDALVNSQMLTEENLRETAKQQRETAKQQRETAKQLQETDKQLKDTDKRLRDLTDLSERYFRRDDRGRNGSEN